MIICQERKIAVRWPERSSFDLPDKSIGTTYLIKIRCDDTYSLIAWAGCYIKETFFNRKYSATSCNFMLKMELVTYLCCYEGNFFCITRNKPRNIKIWGQIYKISSFHILLIYQIWIKIDKSLFGANLDLISTLQQSNWPIFLICQINVFPNSVYHDIWIDTPVLVSV